MAPILFSGDAVRHLVYLPRSGAIDCASRHEMDEETPSQIAEFVDSVEYGNGVSYVDGNNTLQTATDMFWIPPVEHIRVAVHEIAFRLRNEDPDCQLFLSVSHWISSHNAANKSNEPALLHDIILYPVQLKLPDLQPLFVQMGFDTSNVPFEVGADVSKRLLLLVERVIDLRFHEFGPMYLALLMHVLVKPFPAVRSNVVASDWTEVGVQIPKRIIGVPRWQMEPFPFGMGLRRNVDLLAHRIQSMTRVVDPMDLLTTVGDLDIFPADEARAITQLQRVRELVVIDKWKNYGAFIVDMIGFEEKLRARPLNEMLDLFCDFEDGYAGNPNLLVDAIMKITGDNTRFIRGRLAFAGINAKRSRWILTRVSHNQSSVSDGYLATAVKAWSNQRALDSTYLPFWGGDLLLYVLTEGRTEQLVIIVDSIAGGRIPIPWIEYAVAAAATRGSANTFKVLVKKLIDYGMLNPSKVKFPLHDMTLSEIVGKASNQSTIADKLELAMRVGSPAPRKSVVQEHWRGSVATSAYNVFMRNLSVSSAANTLFQPL